MDLDYPAETADFRAELGDWLRSQIVLVRAESADDADFAERWQRLLYVTGWAVPTWPKEYGGRGLDALRASIALDEFVAAEAPLPRPSGGELLLGPTILHWGNAEQRARFLPGIAHGEQIWCQGFSEPESGSDLASVRTRAVLDGEDWILNGHKIWTSEAEDADFMFTLAVTDPEVRPHVGISYLLVPMKQDGIEIRPIAQPDARSGFNEVILHDVRCPTANVLGEPGQGWQVAMGTLGIERGVSSAASHHPYVAEWNDAVAAARANGSIAEPGIRDRLVRSWSEIELLRMQSHRLLTAAGHGAIDSRLGIVGTTFKMFYTELHQRLADLAMDIQGRSGALLTGSQDARQPSGVGMGRRVAHHVYPLSSLQSLYLFSRSQTIYGGSSQVQRNIVAERALGLPRGPR